VLEAELKSAKSKMAAECAAIIAEIQELCKDTGEDKLRANEDARVVAAKKKPQQKRQQ
jgi:hypothetical protein